MPQRQNRYWNESQRKIAVRDLPCYATIYYTDVSIEMQRHTWTLPFLKTTVKGTDATYVNYPASRGPSISKGLCSQGIRQYTGSTNVKSSYLFRS